MAYEPAAAETEVRFVVPDPFAAPRAAELDALEVMQVDARLFLSEL